ncbi:unnamed protein product [Parnassius mnemosyne]|uniref:Reverse transcriptase domain-containing protein n=1 Tax=Parnassius mnemosyne TaxID=213953 RepID=A0AAV1K9M1_9NEOP
MVTQDAIIALTSEIVNNVNNGYKCVTVVLDLIKAFDTVSFPILVQRLEAIGIRVEGKKCWKCPECSASKKKVGGNTQTKIIRCNPDSQNITMSKKSVSNYQTPETKIKELTAVIALLISEFTTLKTKLDELTHSLSHCHERIDELVWGMSANESRLIKLEKRGQEILNLHASLANLQNELNIQAQHGLPNEIEIVRIPGVNNEKLEQILR